MNTAYQLSGKSGAVWTIGLLVSLPLALLTSWLYGLILFHNPFVYFSVLLWVGFLYCTAFNLRITARFGKCRSEAQAKTLGVIFGLSSLYLSWAFFLGAMFSGLVSSWDMIEDPALMFTLIKEIGSEGYYSIFGIDVKGFVLWLIWIIEAIGIILIARGAGRSAIHEEVFCEQCNEWVEETNDVFRTEVPENAVLNEANKGDVDLVLAMAHHSGKEDGAPGTRILRFNYKKCESCDSLATLDWDLVEFSTNSKGEIKKEENDISPVFILTEEQRSLVESRLVD